MKKIRYLSLIVGSFFMNPSAWAQYYFYNDKYYETAVTLELGGSIGIMNSLTDLGGKKGIGKGFIKDLRWQNARPGFSAYILAMYKYAVGLKLEVTFGSIRGYDSILKPVASTTYGRYERNLSFRSPITDIQLSVEIHPLFFKDHDEEASQRFSPFVVAGIGYYSFDPQAKLNGQWYSLQPLCTEGQGFAEYPSHKPYKLKQINFPIGMGIKYEVNSFLNARLELVHRILTTDYLDDVSTTYINSDLFPNYISPGLAVFAQQLYDRQGELDASHVPLPGSQRGDPSDNDAFFSVQLKIGITIARRRR